MDIKGMWRSPLPQLTPSPAPELAFSEFEARLSTYINNHVENEKRAYVWEHVRVRIGEVNRQGSNKITRVRGALAELELTLDPGEQFAFNRAEAKDMIHWLDDEVFGA